MMVDLPQDTEALARRLARAHGTTVEDAVKRAIEESARVAGLAYTKRRMTVEQMLAVGDEIAAMPLLDRHSPSAIMDDLNTQ
jgi:antitoxin VapB